jgi:hypothetical protein
MRASKSRVAVIVIYVLVWSILIAGCFGYYFMFQPINTTQGLNQHCRRAPESDGLRVVKINRSVKFQNLAGKITVSCKLELQDQASLVFDNVSFTTDKFVIENTTSSNSLSIFHSSFKSKTGGFIAKLQTNNSQITIRNSRFEYPLSVAVAVGADDDDSKATLAVSGSYFKSTGDGSSGIGLISSDQGAYADNRFVVNPSEEFAFVIAAHCSSKNNIGASPRCTLD